MKKTYPMISVIVPCYNASATIERCLKSILEQTHPIHEILIYDDCSTDDSAKILARMAKEHPRICVFFGGINKGAGFARTALLQQAVGEFIAFLDADDVWLPQKISTQLTAMEAVNASLCVCYYNVYNYSGELVGQQKPIQHIKYWNMHLANWIPTSMAILRSDLKACRTMPQLRRRQDYAYWLSIFAQNSKLKCVTVPEVLGEYYRMPHSLSSNMFANLKFNYLMFRKTQNYSVLFSILCVCANIVTRTMRT